MALTLHYHPLSSYCWKALLGLYEKELDFEKVIVNLGDPDSREKFAGLWPVAKMPVLEDDDRAIPESTIILEYLDQRFPGASPLLPSDSDLALKVRLADRFYDNYIHTPMQKIVADRIRPAEHKDAYGVQEARKLLALSCGLVDRDMEERRWTVGEVFSLADCAAAPALFYANEVMPLGEEYPHALAYLERLKTRPSFGRVLSEAEPYFAMFPRG